MEQGWLFLGLKSGQMELTRKRHVHGLLVTAQIGVSQQNEA